MLKPRFCALTVLEIFRNDLQVGRRNSYFRFNLNGKISGEIEQVARSLQLRISK